MSYTFSPQELASLKPPEAMTVVEWVEKHRVLPKGSASLAQSVYREHLHSG